MQNENLSDYNPDDFDEEEKKEFCRSLIETLFEGIHTSDILDSVRIAGSIEGALSMVGITGFLTKEEIEMYIDRANEFAELKKQGVIDMKPLIFRPEEGENR